MKPPSEFLLKKKTKFKKYVFQETFIVPVNMTDLYTRKTRKFYYGNGE